MGDLVLLAAGERIPADGILLDGALTVDQSPLTGESREAEKSPGTVSDTATPDQAACLFAGCTVLTGGGEMEVRAVGDATFLGGISGSCRPCSATAL